MKTIKPKWVSVEERLPQTGKVVAAMDRDGAVFPCTYIAELGMLEIEIDSYFPFSIACTNRVPLQVNDEDEKFLPHGWYFVESNRIDYAKSLSYHCTCWLDQEKEE